MFSLTLQIQQVALFEITGIFYGNKSWPDAHSNQMGHTLSIKFLQVSVQVNGVSSSFE